MGRSKTPPKSAAQIKAEKRQEEEMERLDHQEKAMKLAKKRKRRGRATLISEDNDERGIVRRSFG